MTLSSMPPFFVATVSQGLGPAGAGVSVRDARTGGVITLVDQPEDVREFAAIAAIAHDNSFLLTADLRETRATRLFRLKLNSSGNVDGLAAANGVVIEDMTREIAVSSDGSKLAYVVDRGHRTVAHAVCISILDLLTWERKTCTSLLTGFASDLSWVDDGRTLSFYRHTGTTEAGEIRIADTSAQGDWIADSVEIRLPDNSQSLICPVIGRGGESVYCITAEPDPAGGPHWNRLVEIPVNDTGLRTTLFEQRYANDPTNTTYMWNIVRRDGTGRELLLFATGYAYRISVPSGEYSRLPFPEGKPHAAAWG